MLDSGCRHNSLSVALGLSSVKGPTLGSVLEETEIVTRALVPLWMDGDGDLKKSEANITEDRPKGVFVIRQKVYQHC